MPIKLSHFVRISSIITAGESKKPIGFSFPREGHNFWECLCIKEGSAYMTIDDQFFEFSKGDTIFLKPMAFHRIWSKKNEGHTLLGLSFEAENEEMHFFENRVFHLTEPEVHDLKSIVDIASPLIEDRWIEKQLSAEEFNIKAYLVAVKLENFLLLLTQYHDTRLLPTQTKTANEYARIVCVMNNHYDKALQLQDIAKLCGMNVNTLKKIFRQFSEQGVMKSFMQIKIRHAIDLLEEGESIADISRKLGFSTPSYFTYSFRRETGFSPNYYRKNHLKIIL